VTKVSFLRSEFKEWEVFSQRLGFTDFLSPEDGFVTELVTSSKWHNSDSSGIYTWITENKQVYVGQAINARNRLRQHWKSYRDIAYAAFQQFPQTELNKVEPKLVSQMEKQFQILNIKFSKSSASVVPFDSLISAQAAQDFLKGQTIANSTPWRDWPLLETKQQRKYEAFSKQHSFQHSVDVLKYYIESCIPDPAGTEVKFWSVSLLYPQSTYLRVNVGQQEVFTIYDDGISLFGRVLSFSKLSSDFDYPLYQTKSFANFKKLSEFQCWFGEKNVLAGREIVIWLMRHTVPMNSGSHCPQLVRAAFQIK
jgi:hypothetical protein